MNIYIRIKHQVFRKVEITKTKINETKLQQRTDNIKNYQSQLDKVKFSIKMPNEFGFIFRH